VEDIAVDIAVGIVVEDIAVEDIAVEDIAVEDIVVEDIAVVVEDTDQEDNPTGKREGH